jgi:HlyD family secretion protein
VVRGAIRATIAATGTLNPVVSVQVGTQVSGTIQRLFADYNSRVRKGQLIARLDPAAFAAKVAQARADLESAQAMVGDQEALVAKAQADLATAQATAANGRVLKRDAHRKRRARDRLFQEGNLSQEDRDTAQASDDAAAADLAAVQAGVVAAQASLEVAQAQRAAATAMVRQKQAALAQAQVDLDNTAIRSPVDGVVIARNVDVGQTVAASLQAPTLFLIAQDLTQMQVDCNVDEADVGRAVLGQPATFTVDAYPDRAFEGPVVQIRQAPQVVENVVTYDVVVAAANPDRQLLPGMMANVTILVDHREGVLVVPNAAFRVQPTGGGRDKSQRADGLPAVIPRPSIPADVTPEASVGRQWVWVLAGDRPSGRWVQTGLSDGERTEIVAGLQAGEQVILGREAS